MVYSPTFTIKNQRKNVGESTSPWILWELQGPIWSTSGAFCLWISSGPTPSYVEPVGVRDIYAAGADDQKTANVQRPGDSSRDLFGMVKWPFEMG